VTPRYLLARHVFVCMQGEHVVFLDIRNDRYFALEAARCAGLGCAVPGWPVPASFGLDTVRKGREATAAALCEQVDEASLSGAISLLVEKGLLVPATSEGKRADATVFEPLRGDLTADSFESRSRVAPLVFLRFISSAIRARLLLRHRSFDSVIDRARRRADRKRRHGTSMPQSDLHAFIDAFSRLQPFFFAAKDACLVEALALSEFLAGYGVFPSWVFGVQARPFAAHCWLQLDGIVLNDTVDHVKRYTPIMVV